MHLSNNNRIFAMIFYSLLTFFAGPYLAKPLVGNNPEFGFHLGFTLSIFLWIMYGRKL